MNNFVEDEKQNSHSVNKKGSLFIEVILVLWMAGIFLLNLLLFTPPIISSFADQLNMEKPLLSLHNSVQQYFITTDFSKYSVFSDPFWHSIQGFE